MPLDSPVAPTATGSGICAAGACMTGSSTGVAAMIPRAASRIATEAGACGSASTSGVPASRVRAQFLLKRDLAEQRHVDLVGELLASALAEDREALAVGRREAGHVLDHAEHLEVDLGGHVGGALGDRLSGRLRGCDDREAGLG